MEQARDAVAEIELRIPANTSWLRTARITAAAAASAHGVDVDLLEDLSLAVDEACVALMEAAAEGTNVDVRIRATPLSVDVECSAVTDDFELDDIGRSILTQAADTHEIAASGTSTLIRIRKLISTAA